MVSLPKIKIGVSKRKSPKNLSHDVNTTADFGFMQPTLVRECIAGSSGSIQSRAFVRLAPLPVPTFGRIKAKTYTCLVPFKDVFEGYDYFQDQRAINNPARSYIPTEVDKIYSKQLWQFIVAVSMKRWFGSSTDLLDMSKTRNKPFVNMTVLTPSLAPDNLHVNNGSVSFVDRTLSVLGSGLDAINDTTLYRNFHNNCVNIIENITNNGTGQSDDLSLDRTILRSLVGNLGTSHFELWCLEGLDFSNEPKNDVFIDSWLHYQGFRQYESPAFRYGYRNFGDLGHCDFQNFFTNDSGDNKIEISVSLYCDDGQLHSVNVPLVLSVNLTRKGQRLFKVLNACGVNFKGNKEVSLIPLLSYYKAWFDLMNPGRDKAWLETNAYRLIHLYYDYGVTTADFIQNYWDDDVPFADGVCYWYYYDSFIGFLDDLSECFYSLKTDNITAITSSVQINQTSPDVVLYNSSSQSSSVTQQLGGTDYPQLVGNDSRLDGLMLKGLLTMYHWSNKNSVIGAKIEDYLRTRFGYSIPKSNLLGVDEYMIDVQETFSTVNNDDTYLGEYAGRATGYGSGKIKFDLDGQCPATLIQMFVIVPQGGYVQAYPKQHIRRSDFYQEEFDSLGMEVVTTSEVAGRSSIIKDFVTPDTSYGFLPRYFHMKIQNNLHNGDFFRRSQRDSFLPYSLDRIFDEDAIIEQTSKSGVGLTTVLKRQNAPLLVPSEELRFIGKTENLGNYDRIFYDNLGMSDNFIVQIANNFMYYSPSKPISESFDTFDKDNDDSVTSVEKS